jgi:putative peptidoglycan lipid II flippase
MIPPILNIAWLLGILVIAPSLSQKPEVQCSILTFCILAAGVIQLLLHYPFLRRNGFRFDFDFQKVQGGIRQIFKDFFPQVFGLMPMQLNVISASIIAWLLAGKEGTTIYWLNHLIEFPLRVGSASAIYYSERLYEFPQGLIGLAVATAIYPFLSHYAAQKNYTALGEELTLGLRIQFCFAIPAGIGLMLMSEKLAHLLFQRGSFTAADMMRTADMVFWFGTSIWAFCSLPILIRAFYILGDVQTPFRFGLLSCLLNILLGLFLIFPMQEQGLAIAVSLSAGIHATTLLCLFVIKHGCLHFEALLLCIARSIVATFFMAVAVAIVMRTLPGQSSLDDILHIVLGGVVGLFVYFTVYRSLGGRELGILIRGRVRRNKRWK